MSFNDTHAYNSAQKIFKHLTMYADNSRMNNNKATVHVLNFRVGLFASDLKYTIL